ncbi:Secretory phospholipase A2 receptor [Holothuria leucospilota]|uniref:Secretory phospholipase A2 receptor n=1 Tax=Holothuria leucospilota TaxID=206669 RepID=A0A9Q1BYF7_HOLLE|nr:Secretory phospholipase A2 receptor [Holothuria leucospilota]
MVCLWNTFEVFEDTIITIIIINIIINIVVVIIIISITIIFIIDIIITATCPFGYSAIFNNSCYRISNDTDPTLSRSDARKLCESESAHLVFIESKEEDAFLINMTSPDTQYWIGANGLPNNFYWDDGSKIEFKPIGEQNIAFDDLRGCYRMWIAGKESTWPDAPCFRKYNYICEYNLERRTKQCPDDISICTELDWVALNWDWEHTAPELKNSVPAYFDGEVFSDFMLNYASRGIHHLVYRSNDSSNNWCSFRLVTDCMTWTELPVLNTSYALVTNWLRWHEASEACTFYDSNLVTVENEDENTRLQVFISSIGINVWIGLSKEDGWKWQRRNSTSYFFNWGDGEPKSWNSCTVLDPVTAKWKTKPCDSAVPFVCERRLEE